MIVRLVCYLLALVCFLVAAANVPAGRVNLVALGLALWLLPALVEVVE
jgi:hypothetical protein